MRSEPQWRARRRRAIVAAARILFTTSSYDAVQMDAIATHARVGKPTLYRYFPSKQDLYLTVCAESFAELSSHLASIAARSRDPLERLRRFLVAVVDVLSEQLVTLDFLYASDAALTRAWQNLYRAHRSELFNHLCTALDDAVAARQLRDVDTQFTVHLLLGAIRGALRHAPERPANDIVAQLLDVVVLGLTPAGAAPDVVATGAAVTGKRGRAVRSC